MIYRRENIDKSVINMISKGIEEYWKAKEVQDENKIYDKYERK